MLANGAGHPPKENIKNVSAGFLVTGVNIVHHKAPTMEVIKEFGEVFILVAADHTCNV